VVPADGAVPQTVIETLDRWSRRMFRAPERPVGFDLVATLDHPAPDEAGISA
jgi:hypothetical protein